MIRWFFYALALAATVAPGAPSRANAASLRTLSASDGTATVSVPAGWSLVKSGNGYLGVKGPNGEGVNLGVLVVAKNASGGAVRGEVAFALPFSASLREKFSSIMQAAAHKAGTPVTGLTVAGETRMKLPMCERLVGGLTQAAGPEKFEAVVCSLQPDYLGLYKNLVFMLQVPASMAATDRPVVEQIAQSYRVTPAMFKRMLAPYTPLPPRPAGGRAMPGLVPYQDPTNSDCFDYNIIRESPPWEMPMHCGGWQPG